MNRVTAITKVIPLLLFLAVMTGCKKYLDEKPDKRLLVPTKVEDLQILLDNYVRINYREPFYPEVAADDLYVPEESWNYIGQLEQSIHSWQKTRLFEQGSDDWIASYENIYTANLAISETSAMDIPSRDEDALRKMLGHACFVRAKSFLQVAWIWCNAYDPSTAGQELGLPLRLDPDFNIPSKRSTLEETYRQIIADISIAIEYLPATAVHVMRPSKVAAYALMARTYLSMRAYDSCLKYSNLALSLTGDLMDYNGDDDVDPTAIYPFSQFNKEVVYESRYPYPASIYAGKVDSTLYQMYGDGDLRKTMFFPTPTIEFWVASYSPGYSLFSGIATDELWLMRAECNARTGKAMEALADLNTLLVKRWKTGEFIPYTETQPDLLLNLILQERRKELVLRGLRWMDIKRLNKEGRNILLKRVVNGGVFELEPNASRYAAPIPNDVIDRSDVEQNP